MNPTEPVLTQPTDVPPATPSNTIDYKTEYEKLKRQFDGREGYIKTLTTEKTKANDLATQLSTDFEQFKNEVHNPIASQFDQIKTAKEQLESSAGQTKAELETLRLVSTEFPNLAPYVAKGMINPNGKQGDDLRKFLTDWNTEFASLGIQNIQQQNSGSTPPVPAANPQSGMTFEEVGEARLEVLRTLGANSKEFKALKALEEQLIGQGKFTMSNPEPETPLFRLKDRPQI